MVHVITPPLIQSSFLRSTYSKYVNIFSEVSPRTARTVPSNVSFLSVDTCSIVREWSVVWTIMELKPEGSEMMTVYVKTTDI